MSTNTRHEFDFCVIGGGSAGFAAATTARNLGRSVAIADGPGELGGLCILRGCMPSKTLLRTAEVAHLIREAPKLGVEAGPPKIDFAHVMDRKRTIIKGFADYRADAIKRFPLFHGAAKFVAPGEIQVGNDRIAAKKFLVATGSTIAVPAIAGLGETGFVTSDEVLAFDTLPPSVVVLGGGTIACELAQYLVRLGVETTIVQRSATLLSDEDPDVAASLRMYLERDGISVATGTKILAVERVGDQKRVHYERDGKANVAQGNEIFLAFGRLANIGGLDLEKAGVDASELGIKVDRFLRTTNPDVFAAGDVVFDSSQLVHVAVHEGELAARNALGSSLKSVDYPLQRARAVFTDPQVAVAGLTERECKTNGVAYSAASFPFDDLGKAIATNLTDGFVKMLAAPDGAILGVAIVGAEASNFIHEAIALLYFKANIRDVLMMPHLHPTLAEIITYPAEELCERLEHEKRVLVTP